MSCWLTKTRDLQAKPGGLDFQIRICSNVGGSGNVTVFLDRSRNRSAPPPSGRAEAQGRAAREAARNREGERRIAPTRDMTRLQDRPGDPAAVAACPPWLEAPRSPTSDRSLGSDTRRRERPGPSGDLSLAGGIRPRAARRRSAASCTTSSSGRGAVTRQGAASAASPQGLTATAAHNVSRSAGRAPHPRAIAPRPTRHAARPADLPARAATPSHNRDAPRTTAKAQSRHHLPPDFTAAPDSAPLAGVGLDRHPDKRGQGSGPEDQARRSRAKGKAGKDAGSANSSAIRATEDTASRSLAAVRAESGPTERTHAHAKQGR